ncbi:mitochondrial import receptor subunit TOM5 [Populus alba x Populus x berolinensis]|nr:mitochondrial import receptor subunit TOM5 [Populus alba x Populus x berolinensis]
MTPHQIKTLISVEKTLFSSASLKSKTLNNSLNLTSSPMADSSVSTDKIKAFWHSQVHDEEKWALNMKLLRAVGLFAGSIFLMRNYGDLMAI